MGPGIFLCRQLLEGQYRLTRNGDRAWGDNQKYPFYNYDRIGDCSDDAEMTPLQVLSV